MNRGEDERRARGGRGEDEGRARGGRGEGEGRARGGRGEGEGRARGGRGEGEGIPFKICYELVCVLGTDSDDFAEYFVTVLGAV